MDSFDFFRGRDAAADYLEDRARLIREQGGTTSDIMARIIEAEAAAIRQLSDPDPIASHRGRVGDTI